MRALRTRRPNYFCGRCGKHFRTKRGLKWHVANAKKRTDACLPEIVTMEP